MGSRPKPEHYTLTFIYTISIWTKLFSFYRIGNFNLFCMYVVLKREWISFFLFMMITVCNHMSWTECSPTTDRCCLWCAFVMRKSSTHISDSSTLYHFLLLRNFRFKPFVVTALHFYSIDLVSEIATKIIRLNNDICWWIRFWDLLIRFWNKISTVCSTIGTLKRHTEWWDEFNKLFFKKKNFRLYHSWTQTSSFEMYLDGILQ